MPHVGNRRHRVACLILRYSLIKLVTYLIKPISCSAVGVLGVDSNLLEMIDIFVKFPVP